MALYDIWLDLECEVDGTQTVVCTLFANRDFPIRPIIGENITFWSGKDTQVRFNLYRAPEIHQNFHYVPTEIDDVAHHLHPNEGSVSVKICVFCRPVHVATIADARRVVDFLSTQHGFEVDPYALNKLKEGHDTA